MATLKWVPCSSFREGGSEAVMTQREWVSWLLDVHFFDAVVQISGQKLKNLNNQMNSRVVLTRIWSEICSILERKDKLIETLQQLKAPMKKSFIHGLVLGNERKGENNLGFCWEFGKKEGKKIAEMAEWRKQTLGDFSLNLSVEKREIN